MAQDINNISAGPAPAANGQSSVPLIVDLDGTLVRTNMLVESAISAFRSNGLVLLRAPGWLSQGRATLKKELAARATIDVRALPYREDVLAYVREARAAGRTVILATAADGTIAQQVAEHLGLFDEVLASDGTRNLRGSEKLAAIRERCREGFDYLGNDASDVPIWDASTLPINAGHARFTRVGGHALSDPLDSAGRLRPILKLLRPHQWAKNALIFVPLMAAHALSDRVKIAHAALAVVAFSLMASTIYVINDLLDVQADRLHPRKRRRPLASGAVALAHAPAIAATTFLIASVCGFTISPQFVLVLLFYAALSIAYSVDLKARLLVDVLVLAMLYTIRIIAGSVATGIVISPWLGALSLFLFTSLAMAKRYTEVAGHLDRSAGVSTPLLAPTRGKLLPGRDYGPEDLETLRSAGLACGVGSVLVLALYVNSPIVGTLYRHPAWLWLACPLMLYWVMRIWFFAGRGALHDDPVVFAITDRVSWLTGLAMAVVAAAASIAP